MPNEDLSGTQRAAALAAQAPESDVQFLERSREEFATDKQRDMVDRAEGQDDHKFTFSSDATVRGNGVGSQWSDKAFKARKAKKLPTMQWNRMHIYQQHVENSGRQNDFAIKVSQADGGDKETSEYYQDRIRQIEYENNFNTVSSIARSNQLSAGRGWYRVSTKYRKGTWEQYICLEEVADAFSIYTGPYKQLDCSDAERMWEIFYITKAQYKRSYGQKRLDEALAFADDPNSNMSEWADVGTSGQMMQIARKYQKEITKRMLYQAADGVTGIPESDIPDVAMALEMGMLSVDDDGKPITREEEVCKVWCYLIDGAHILKKEEFIVDEIALIPQWGLCTVLDGVQRHFSMGNRAKEPQRLLNLAISNLAALVGAQSKAKFMMDLAQIEKQHQNDWAGLTNAVLLLYNRRDKDGLDLGVPQQVVDPPQIVAVLEMYREAIEGIKAAYGVYDAQLGKTRSDQSGKAIDSLKEQGEQVNFHFLANEGIAQKRLGQIMVKIIQKIDQAGSQRTVRTEAGKTHTVPIGQPFKHYRTGKEATIQPKSDVELGITVDMGPSYQSARKQVNETDLVLIKSLPPEAALVLLPEFLRTQDAPNSEGRAEIAERLVNKLQPGVLPPKEEDGPQLPPEAAQQMQAQAEEIQKLQAFSQSLHEKIQTDQVKQDAENARQERELAFKREELASKERVEMAKLGSKEDIVLLQSDLQQIEAQAGLKHDAAKTAVSMAHEAQEADTSREHQTSEAESAREATAEQADLGRQHELTAAELAAKQTQGAE